MWKWALPGVRVFAGGRAPSGLGSTLALRFWTSLFSETANCVHPPPRLCVCPPGWKAGSPTDFHRARARSKETASTEHGSPLAPDPWEGLRLGFVLDEWFGDF